MSAARPCRSARPNHRQPYNGGMHSKALMGWPVSIPDDMEDRSLAKASGWVTLPRHVAWSFPYGYDLDDRKDCGPATRG